MFGEARRLTIRPSIVAAVVFATALLASCRFPSSHRPPPLAATPRAVAATAYAQPVTPNLPASRLVATSRPAFLDLDNDGEDDRNDEREEDEANDPDRIGPDGHRRIGNDHPLEAVRFRTLSLQDQSGRIADNGLMAAAGHVRNMRGAQPPEAGAGISRGAWTWLGPGNIGGRIRALAIHPTATSTMFAGSVSGGIWRTTNGGAAWAPVDDFMANLAVSSIVFTPGSPNVMYAGTGEGFYNTDGIRGAGIFKSTDGGSTWTQLPHPNPAQLYYVNRLAVSPDGNTILAATRSGIFRSIDAGVTFTQQSAIEMMDIDFHPTDSTRAVASGSFGNAYYTINGGLSWTAATGLGGGGRVEIAYAPSAPSTVYASVDASGGTFFVSTDGGASYTLRFSGAPDYLGNQGWYDNAIWVNPFDPNFIVVGGIDLYRSIDGGASWTVISNWSAAPVSAHADHHIIVSHPNFNNTTNKTVFFGNDGGVYRATDISTVGGAGGVSGWTVLNNNLGVTQFYGGAGHAGTGRIVGGTQDNGTLVYTPAGGTQGWTTSFGGDGGWSAADPTNGNNLYGEYVFLALHRSLNGGASSDWINGLYWNGSTYICKPAPYRIGDDGGTDGCSTTSYGTGANFIAPFVLDPSNPARLLAGGLRLWRTNDANAPNTPTTGPSWAAIKPSIGSNISAIAIAPTNSDIVWVGHNNGNVYRTANGTAPSPTLAQRDLTSPALPNRYVTRITIDPSDANIVYVTFGGFSADNVYRTLDGGATWTSIAGTGLTALPAAPIRDLEVNPANSNWIYAATEVGIFASEDAGATWTLPHEGPANVSVDELFFMGPELVAVTHGRGMFKQTPAAGPSMPSLSIDDVAVTEGNSGTTPATFTVTLSGPSAQTVTVNYATSDVTAAAGSDYTAVNGTLTFAPGGPTTQLVTVNVSGDTTAEATETFRVTLSSPSNATLADAQGIGTITNDDAAPTPTISATPSSVLGGGTVQVTVTNGPGNPLDWVALRSGGVNQNWWYLNGTKAPPAAGVTDGSFPITMPSTPGSYELRLLENDGPNLLATTAVTVSAPSTLTITDATVAEGNSGTTAATFIVTLSPSSAQSVSVNYATANGTAAAGSDYMAAAGTLNFAPGETTKTFDVTVNGDTAIEPTETFTVQLTSPLNAVIGDSTGLGTITNDDVIAPPSISAHASATWGLPVAVTVSNGPGNPRDWIALRSNGVNRDWWYLNGTKVAPAAGVTSANLSLPLPAGPGTYEVRLLENDGPNVLATSGTVTATAPPSLTINDISVTEGNSGTTPATFTVSLTPASNQTVTVNYATGNLSATAGVDYVAASGTVTFPPGSTSQSIAIAVNGDTAPESNETFQIMLSAPVNAGIADGQGIGTIVNDDASAASISAPVSAPGGTNVAVTVSNGPGNRLDWIALRSGGVNRDWWYLNGTRIPPATGVTNAVLSLPLPAGPGTYEFRLLENDGPNVLATSGSVTATVPPLINIDNVTVAEGNSGSTTATFTVTLSAASAQTVTVSYATANGTATAGSDYTPATGTLSFAPGVLSQTLAVAVIGDTNQEGNETFLVNLASPVNAVINDGQGVGTITNDDAPPPPAVSGSPGTVNAGGTVLVSVVNGPGNARDWVALRSGGVNVAWWYLNGLTVPPATGVSSASFSITMPTAAGTYEIRLLENDGPNVLATDSVTVTAPPSLSINDIALVEGNSGSTAGAFTVTLSQASAQIVTVNYATANATATAGSDYTAVSGTLTFNPGVTTQTIPVSVIGDTTPEPAETFVVNLSGAVNATVADAQGVATIANDDAAAAPTIVATPASVPIGGTVTVTIANGPGNRLDWIALRSNGVNRDWWYMSGTRTPPPSGMTSASFPVTLTGPLGNYEFLFLENDGSNLLATSNAVTVAPLPTLSINDVAVVEGHSGSATATFTVSLSAPSPNVVTVSYATASGTATQGIDFTQATGVLSFTPGNTTRTIDVSVISDMAVESNETFVVNLTAPTNATIADGQGVGTITNDDTPVGPVISASPLLVETSGQVAVTVTNGPGNPLDWVALRSGGVNRDWWYLSGTKTAPVPGLNAANFVVTMPATPGSYEFRLLENDGPNVLAQSGTVTVTVSGCADSDNDRLCNAYETGTGVYVGPTNTGTSPTNNDTDGDGIFDGDEVLGTIAGLNLPAMGASPLKKNIIFEYDWIDDNSEPGTCSAHSHRPTQAIADRVSAAFAAAPVTNPDGTNGIVVIHDFGQGGVFTGGSLISHTANIAGDVFGADYAATKSANFAANRNGYVHYVVMPHWYTGSLGSSGVAELPGDDVIVSLGCFITTNNVANTLVHEVGHNLNLRHGGNENCNYKPNYNSVMNYRYQFPGVDTSCNALGSNGEPNTLDFSRGTRIPLNESNLNENAGVCGATPIDWDGSGGFTTGLAYELNRNPSDNSIQNGSCAAPTMTLNDYNDWANIYFNGIADGSGQSLLSMVVRMIQEEIAETNPVPRIVPPEIRPRQ